MQQRCNWPSRSERNFFPKANMPGVQLEQRIHNMGLWPLCLIEREEVNQSPGEILHSYQLVSWHPQEASMERNSAKSTTWQINQWESVQIVFLYHWSPPKFGFIYTLPLFSALLNRHYVWHLFRQNWEKFNFVEEHVPHDRLWTSAFMSIVYLSVFYPYCCCIVCCFCCFMLPIPANEFAHCRQIKLLKLKLFCESTWSTWSADRSRKTGNSY